MTLRSPHSQELFLREDCVRCTFYSLLRGFPGAPGSLQAPSAQPRGLLEPGRNLYARNLSFRPRVPRPARREMRQGPRRAAPPPPPSPGRPGNVRRAVASP